MYPALAAVHQLLLTRVANRTTTALTGLGAVHLARHVHPGRAAKAAILEASLANMPTVKLVKSVLRAPNLGAASEVLNTTRCASILTTWNPKRRNIWHLLAASEERAGTQTLFVHIVTAVLVQREISAYTAHLVLAQALLTEGTGRLGRHLFKLNKLEVTLVAVPQTIDTHGFLSQPKLGVCAAVLARLVLLATRHTHLKRVFVPRLVQLVAVRTRTSTIKTQ